MNVRRFIMACLGVFAFIFIFEWVFHGVFLKPLYEMTWYLWRAPEDCITWAMVLGQLMFPFIFGWIFLKGYENKGIGEGIRFGILIGILFVPYNFVIYAVQPLPIDLVALWSLGGILETAFCGAIFAAIYKP